MVNFLLVTLHEELNKPNKLGNLLNYDDQTNKKLAFNNFVDCFKTNNLSIISDLFFASNYNMTQCSNCKVITYNYQFYFYKFFPLEEIRKFKSRNFSSSIYNNINYNTVNIYDCFEYDRRIQLMTGENAMYCNFCKKTCDAELRTCLATGPEILIIILNRG